MSAAVRSNDLEASLAEGRRSGRSAAEAFEASLRHAESSEREQRLLAIRAHGRAGEPRVPSVEREAELGRLRSEVESLREFRRAVLASKGWRLLQSLRRLVGRSW